MTSLADVTTKASEAIASFRSKTPASSARPEAATFQAVIAELQALGQAVAGLTAAFAEKDIHIKKYIDDGNQEIRSHIDASIAGLLNTIQTPGQDNWLANSIEGLTEDVGKLRTRLINLETAPDEDLLPAYRRQAVLPRGPGSAARSSQPSSSGSSGHRRPHN
jgi:hypothetical protein